MTLNVLITLGYYVSSLGFLVASYFTLDAVRKSSQSGLKTVLTYLFIGTGIFFVITIFQKLGADFFGIPDESMDIWWHLMFYLAMISYYIGFKALAKLGTNESSAETAVNTSAGVVWGVFCVLVLIMIFIIPSRAESLVSAYLASSLGGLGAHHFIAFIMAGVIGAYLFSAKMFLGQIGRAIASPMIIAIWALAAQHLWELLTESLKVLDVSSTSVEGGEKIFLIIAAVCVTATAIRLRNIAGNK